MKTKPTTTTENHQDVSLPSREQLAMIAANTHRKSPGDAVRHALEIWREADKVLRSERIAIMQRPFTDIPSPPKFPATLRDFLRLIVHAKTPSDSWKQLRRYLREQHRIYLFVDKSNCQEAAMQGRTGIKKIRPPAFGAEDAEQVERRVAAEIESMRKDGLTQMQWRRLAFSYRNWWRTEKSNQARISAKKTLATGLTRFSAAFNCRSLAKS